MSLATFKRKTMNSRMGPTRISGKTPGGIWLSQGPFGGNATIEQVAHNGPVGFSINGAHRSRPSGDMKMSKSGTPYRGQYPVGYGGLRGRYVEAEPLLNAGDARIKVAGNQWEFVKPSVLSTRGMLHGRFRWAYSGQYPNAWVQPVYSGNQSDSKSQGVYLQSKSAATDIHQDVNHVAKYENYFRQFGPNGCNTTPASGYTITQQQHNAPYTKTLFQPRTAGEHTRQIQQPCATPNARQQPFPYAVQTGTGVQRGGLSVSHIASACHVGPPVLRSQFL
jgi:hypothetical protein